MGTRAENQKQAKQRGCKTYFTGKSCKNGHMSERYTSNRKCVDCSKIWNRSERQREYNKWYKEEFKEELREKNANNRERIRKREREYAKKNKERLALKRKEWQQNNRERINKTKRERYKVTKDKILEREKRWRENNRDRYHAIKHSGYQRRKKLINGGPSSTELADWVENQEKICFWCDKYVAKGYHLDHFFPLSKGGKHSLDNLVISCADCNIKKQAKLPHEFAKEIGKKL